MFIEDIRHDFYNVLLGNRVLLLVHYDVDAICTCKILQGLFKSDNISYTLVPVGGISELKTAYEENSEEIKYVVLVNCGGTVDLVDILQPEEDVVFFVLDAHKPTDVCNAYSDGQIRLVYKDREENIPEFDDIFKDDEDVDDDSEIESGRDIEAVVERRRAKRAWEERRNNLMFNYTQFSYYGKPSACVALELCWRLSRGGQAAAWCCGVALGAGTRDRAQVSLDTALQDLTTPALYTKARVVLEKEPLLPLLRWWSVDAALRHSPALGPHLRLHTLSGHSRLLQLLADMGFPLAQARQAYRSMDVELRRRFMSSLEACYEKYNLPEPTQTSFLLHRPHFPVLASLDVVYAIMGLIEHDTIPKEEGFQLALSALEITEDNESLRTGIQSAQKALENISKLANSILSSRQLHLAGPFSYFIVPEEVSVRSSALSPLWLRLLGAWVGVVGGGGGGGGRAVLAAQESGGRCLVVGVPPSSDTRNLFGAAFEQAAAKSGVSVSMDFVDSSIITLPISQRTQFLDSLTALLA